MLHKGQSPYNPVLGGLCPYNPVLGGKPTDPHLGSFVLGIKSIYLFKYIDPNLSQLETLFAAGGGRGGAPPRLNVSVRISVFVCLVLRRSLNLLEVEIVAPLNI